MGLPSASQREEAEGFRRIFGMIWSASYYPLERSKNRLAMAMIPSVNPSKIPEPQTPTTTLPENPNPDGCKKHCHYPTVLTKRYSAGSDIVRGCPCMENHRDCDFEWEATGRGFCKNCHHASSMTVKESDCKLDF